MTAFRAIPFLSVALVLAACDGPVPAEQNPTPPPGSSTAPAPVEIRWFIGLGTGTNPEQYYAEVDAVEAFNASQEGIEIVIDEPGASLAIDVLATMIAEGNPPDILGPVGHRVASVYSSQWMDIEPLLSDYDLSAYNPAVFEAWRVPGRGIVGFPAGVYPSAIFYNRDLFDAAGVPYPPHGYDQPYADGEEWTVDKMQEVAMLLTLDATGRNAYDPAFDAEDIVQYGYVPLWALASDVASLFGPGSFVDGEGNGALPEQWAQAFRWYYDGIWASHFVPGGLWVDGEPAGNPFDEGNVAMAHSHSWYTCCVGDVVNWDLAAVPAYDGQVTAKLHADMIGLFRSTERAEEAMEALYYLATQPKLIDAWHGMPPPTSLQAGFFAELDERFPQGVDWQVFVDGLDYPDVPNHEWWLPGERELGGRTTWRADDRLDEFYALLSNTPGLDVEAELEALIADLEAIFD